MYNNYSGFARDSFLKREKLSNTNQKKARQLCYNDHKLVDSNIKCKVTSAFADGERQVTDYFWGEEKYVFRDQRLEKIIWHSRTEVLKGIDFSVEKGQICVLLGPSGSGKSTLLNIIGGIDQADEGYVSINGEKTADMKEKRLTQYRRRHLGYVFQMYNLIPNLSVRENIEVGAYLSDRPLELDELLKTLGLYEHRNKLPNQLSGGQQQRTAIGRAIIKNPDILLCDEPTGALDYKTSKEILCLIEQINQKYGNTVIMVTHNDAIKNMADRVVKLRDGQIRKNYVNETKIAAADLEW